MTPNCSYMLSCLLVLLAATLAPAQPPQNPQESPPPAARKQPPQQPGQPAKKKQPNAAKPPQTSPVIDAAIKKLASYQWVQARLRQRVELFNQRIEGTGSYLKGPNWQMRLELKLALGNGSPSSLTQVCDGRYLWDFRDLPESPALRKVDVVAVQDALRKGAAPAHAKQQLSGIGLGGLEQLLRGLSQRFDFTDAGRMLVGDQPRQALLGQWNRTMLARMLPQQKKEIDAGKPADLSTLASEVPTEVLLLLGPENLFPYRIEYRRRQADEEITPGQPLPGKALVIIELYDVQINKPVDELNFLYKPDMRATDVTEEYLRAFQVGQE